MSGDGRESNYDEPNAMKAYAIAQGVPESAIYCDGGGYHTYDTMWRVANVMARKAWPLSRRNTTNIARCLMRKAWVCQPLAWWSDTGTWRRSGLLRYCERPARVQDAISVWTGRTRTIQARL